MKVKVGNLYKLDALWHQHHGEMVEIIRKDAGKTIAHEGKTIYQIAYNPLNDETRREDTDEEFVASNFKECVLDDDVVLYDLLTHFDDLPGDVADCARRIKKKDDKNSYVYIYNGWLEATFGKTEAEARNDAFKYMIERMKAENAKKNDRASLAVRVLGKRTKKESEAKGSGDFKPADDSDGKNPEDKQDELMKS